MPCWLCKVNIQSSVWVLDSFVMLYSYFAENFTKPLDANAGLKFDLIVKKSE